MHLSVHDKKLKHALDNERECTKLFGKDMARKLTLRVNALSAAESLADFWPPLSGPERCHELKNDLAGTFSMDVKQPYRLLFKPVDPEKKIEGIDGKERWLAIRSVELIGIEDTHG